MPSCPTAQQSRNQTTGDKIASATNSAGLAPRLSSLQLLLPEIVARRKQIKV
jgi:hypothetical protein